MKIVYLNHTGAISGAERSLLELMAHLPPEVEPVLVSPEGPLHDAAKARGVAVQPVPWREASLSVSPREAVTATAALVASGRHVARLARATGAELIHANSIRAGVAAVVASIGGPPAIVHLRDTLPPGPLTSAVMGTIALGATSVIGNSHYTATAFSALSRRRRGVHAIYNPIDLKRFTPEGMDRSAIRERLGVAESALVLGVVGQITPWKGQDTAVRALGEVRARHPDAVLLIAGEAKFVGAAVRHDNAAYLERLRAMASASGLGDAVRFLGEREDVVDIFGALDVLLVPSWEEPFGRVVVEGMAMGLPVIATAKGGPAEIISDGVDGMLADPEELSGWAERIERIAGDPALRDRLARAARERATAFGVHGHVAAVVGCYERALATRPGLRRRWV
ncbi:MAG: hypothetical protein QOI64_1846 [Solirubrobacteraceae bacterium]|jgi:glycosyltransferase involved in cell wall biosynthesis|nr:hypothetical protein [Solirubrobacteraceae bacterium]